MTQASKETLVDIFRNYVASKYPDLLPRQIALLLQCSGRDPSCNTVRALSRELGISKPVITRALNRLEDYSYVIRLDDPTDQRSIYVQVTNSGEAFVEYLTGLFEAM